MASRPFGLVDPAADIRLPMPPVAAVLLQTLLLTVVVFSVGREPIENRDLPEVRHFFETCGRGSARSLVVNVLPDRRGGPPLLNVRGHDLDPRAFRERLRRDADIYREPEPPGASELWVEIRADRRTRWADVDHVLQACTDPSIRVYKLRFATAFPSFGEGR